jgi:uncharacterized protein YbaP (TraB family)
MRALLVLSCLFAHATLADPHAVLWSVHGAHNTVYLAGSMHFLPESVQLPAAFLAAYSEAEKLVMELDMDDIDPMQVQMLTLQQGMLDEGRTLEDELGSAAFGRVKAQAEQLGMDASLLQRMRPWLAALTLTQLQLVKLGWSPESGVEQRFVRMASTDHKEITGLESLDTQINLLASMPPELQRQFVLYSVDDAATMPQEIKQLGDAWRAGDVTRLESIMNEELRKYPALYEPLTTARNRKWLKNIEPLLKERDDYLIIVGAAHLVGRDSVVYLLQRDGFTVTRH